MSSSTPTPDEERIDPEPPRRPRDVPMDHYALATSHLRLASEAQRTDVLTAHATLALAHAQMLVANETRIGNLISALSVNLLRGSTAAAQAKVQLLESRVDSALGLDEIQVGP